MRVLVTGGTGFIGAHTVRQLAAASHQLRCLVRDPARAQAPRDAGAEIVLGDVTDKPSVVAAVRGCDAVVNLANLFEFWVPDRRAFAAVNVEGTRNVMEAALESGVSKVVHVSTVVVWGNATWPITEATPYGARCASEYARTKRAGDEVAWRLAETRKLPVLMVYPGAVIGPNDPKATGRYLRSFVRGTLPAQVLTRCVFPFVDVRDVATGIVKALELGGNVGERYILVAESLTFGELNRLLIEITGARLPRLTFPDWFTLVGAYFATGLADLIGKPPMLDMAVDQMKIMMQGCQADGSKATCELGLTYTPIREAVRAAVASM